MDQIVGGAETQEVMAAAIPNSTLLYPDQGHAAYEEAKDFNDVVLAFFMEEASVAAGGRAD